MKLSCGLLCWRLKGIEPEFFLVHAGGPFWANKDDASWGIPKGEISRVDQSDTAKAAIREFREETGFVQNISKGLLHPLGRIEQNHYKAVECYAYEFDLGDDFVVKSNMCTIEGKNGEPLSIPEVDRGQYFTYAQSLIKIHPKQIYFIEEAMETVVRKAIRKKTKQKESENG
jgi:predicted NUDIX family NTP pyrophosphohydrolase